MMKKSNYYQELSNQLHEKPPIEKKGLLKVISNTDLSAGPLIERGLEMHYWYRCLVEYTNQEMGSLDNVDNHVHCLDGANYNVCREGINSREFIDRIIGGNSHDQNKLFESLYKVGAATSGRLYDDLDVLIRRSEYRDSNSNDTLNSRNMASLLTVSNLRESLGFGIPSSQEAAKYISSLIENKP